MTAGKAFSRALTLPERYGRPTGAQPAPEAAGRLARWRQQPPFAEEKWWQARLSADGITEPGLLVLLSDGEAARLPTPLWAADFAAIMQEPGPGRDMSEDPGSALFAPAVASLLAAVHADLRDRLRGIDGAAFDPDELARLLCAPLPQIMHQMLLRTLVLELHRSRAAGELTGDSPAARFASFTAALRDDPDRRQSLFTAYPVLARQLAVRAQTWTGASARFAAHLAADLDDIEQMLAGDRRLGTPAEVLTGLGDQHRGASVTLVRWPDGTGARLPIAGFAHGNAGIILALTLAAKILGDEACRDAADEALAYEQALFDPARGVWAELGDPQLLRAAGKVPDRAYWCYGGTGIGLSRLRMRSDLDPGHTGSLEVEAALTLLDTQPVSSHCLCHGELGNIELYLQAAVALNRPELREQARTRGLDTAEAIRASGWRCGMPLNIQTPGLMFGLAGIGYGMLRLAEPASVPAVLTLQF